MCGRAAQTTATVQLGSSKFGLSPTVKFPSENSTTSWNENSNNQQNMSPGQDFLVLRGSARNNRSHKSEHNSEHDTKMQKLDIVCESKIWGLITRHGTPNDPLPIGPSKHFANLMFNARSETAKEKKSFRPLLQNGQTCIIALDGFYEWKSPENGLIRRDTKKQPYYVHRKGGVPLLTAGLYTNVPTGRKMCDGTDEMLSTFTILTTSACSKLGWLHHRMPLIIWSESDAIRWLKHPSPELMLEMSLAISRSNHDDLVWHPVTKKVNSVKYAGNDCNKPVAIESIPSVKSFFKPKEKCKYSLTSNCPPQQKKHLGTCEGEAFSPNEEDTKLKLQSIGSHNNTKIASPVVKKRKLSNESKYFVDLTEVDATSPTKKAKLASKILVDESFVATPKGKPRITKKPHKSRKGSITSFFSLKNT